MPTTFRGLSLFDSGPNRFKVMETGRLFVVPLVGLNTGNPFLLEVDVKEAEYEQVGRLVAATESALWMLSDAIQAEAELQAKGDLVLPSGRTFPGLNMLRYDPGEVVDRGRLFSMAYRIEYRKTVI